VSDYSHDRAVRDGAMADWLRGKGVQLVVLAGYMQILGPAFLDRFSDAVINLHPALLPAFPGLDAVGQAISYGVKVFGVTVHFVDEGVDSGPVIMQRSVELPDAREVEDVLPHIHAIEHQILPEVVRLFARGAVRIASTHPRRVLVGPLAVLPER
jgi:phosphoribosylglycinamide formyltransferase-1